MRKLLVIFMCSLLVLGAMVSCKAEPEIKTQTNSIVTNEVFTGLGLPAGNYKCETVNFKDGMTFTNEDGTGSFKLGGFTFDSKAGKFYSAISKATVSKKAGDSEQVLTFTPDKKITVNSTDTECILKDVKLTCDEIPSLTFDLSSDTEYKIPLKAAIAVTGVTLDKETATVEVGSTITLTATVEPTDAANKNVSWSTSDATKATVAEGVVTGVAKGTVTITVTTKDGSKTASCTVTVNMPVTTGSGNVTGASAGRTTCGWVQLWKDGPKWAEFSVGATISDYANVTGTGTGWDNTATASGTGTSSPYCLATCGGFYEWGGTTHKDTGSTSGTDYSSSTTDIQGTGTAGGQAGTLGDTAYILWGSNWKMPKKSDFDNLRDSEKCTWTWCSGQTNSQYVDGCTLAGYKVTGNTVGYTEASIFFPVSGYFRIDNQIIMEDNINIAGTIYNYKNGRFWSSTPASSGNANCLKLERDTTSSSDNNGVKDLKCYLGFPVRAIYVGE